MTNKLIRDIAQSIVDGSAFRPRIAICLAPEMANPARRKAKLASIGLPVGQVPAVAAPAPADPELAAANKLIEEVADRLGEDDAKALREADRVTKLRFATRLRNQRALNEEQRQRDEAKRTAEAEAAKVKESNRLAYLGVDVAKAERDK